jgi:hypothetical protein
VHALFSNFSFERVAKALPDAWAFASPIAALASREQGATASLRRQLGDLAGDERITAAADLLARAAEAAPVEGRPLFAANRALAEPHDPVARLWHFATLLREHRGDGHVSTLLALGITGRQSHVLHSLASAIPRSVYVAARDFGDDEWEAALADLRSSGYVDGDGNLSRSGHDVKEAIEAQTDRLAGSAYDNLSDRQLDDLHTALRPVARAVVEAGDIPLDAPMGLNLRDLTS